MTNGEKWLLVAVILVALMAFKSHEDRIKLESCHGELREANAVIDRLTNDKWYWEEN